MDNFSDAIKDSPTARKVIEVPVPKAICEMGGSVRCLSYALKGDNADKIVNHVQSKAT